MANKEVIVKYNAALNDWVDGIILEIPQTMKELSKKVWYFK